jgi:hypothetical protein
MSPLVVLENGKQKKAAAKPGSIDDQSHSGRFGFAQ